ncbi:hypothetical protein B0H11DRAFT_1846685 [Mycena galericulata]|nr:hypothetical protein B0H11DRAFT_1846685 [Mycena galericulata]
MHSPPDNPAEFVELASVPNPRFDDNGWCCCGSRGVAMQNGWTRFRCSEVSNSIVSRMFRILQHDTHVWLSQATHILDSLQITDNYEEFRCVRVLEFRLRLKEHLPDGYLFLCPLNDLQAPVDGFFQITDSQAYWSLDTSGIQELSVEEALSLGFPAPVLQVELFGVNLREYEYSALRQFHQAKGFDPDSPDVARHLGYPFYQIYPQTDAPFAHG